MSRPAVRVLFLALDACDAGLLQELAARGVCPNVADLLRAGAVVDTVAPYGTFVGSSWMTISTGFGPGSHRYWNWLEVDPVTYENRETTPRESRRPPFWQHLSDAGRRVAVFDVPHADIPAEFNGIVLKEWGCHDRHFGTASYPPELRDEVDRAVGAHPYGSQPPPGGSEAFAPCDYTLRTDRFRTREEEFGLLSLMRAGVEHKLAATRLLMQREPWDLMIAVFGECHCVGHQFWHVHDPGHPRHDAAVRRRLGDPVVDIYARIDRAVGELVDAVGPDTVVWLQLNHGMGPHFDGAHLLDAVLDRADGALAGTGRVAGWRGRVAARTLTALAGPARDVATRVGAAAIRVTAGATSANNWPSRPRAERRFYQVPGNTSVGAVRFNVVGRESLGRVGRGAELTTLQAALVDVLAELVNVDTGRRAVRDVVYADDVMVRSDDDGLPDMFVEWDRSAPLERLWSPRLGMIVGEYSDWRTGDHHDRGLAVVRGAGIRSGRRQQPMPLQDVAPTLCELVGSPMLVSDGNVRRDMLGERGVTRPSPATGPATSAA